MHNIVSNEVTLILVRFVEVCTDGKEYTECANLCDLTCKDKAGVDECVSEACVAGCRCSMGTFLDESGNCVEECPCYEGEMSYDVGDQMPADEECEVWLVFIAENICHTFVKHTPATHT